MILFLEGTKIMGRHDDDTIKEQERYKSDEACKVVEGDTYFPPFPNHDYWYTYHWIEEKVQIVQGDKIEANAEGTYYSKQIEVDRLDAIEDKLSSIMAHLGIS